MVVSESQIEIWLRLGREMGDKFSKEISDWFGWGTQGVAELAS